MIRIYLRFYEELNDFLPAERRKKEFEHQVKSRSSIKDVIEAIGVPHNEVDLILINGKSVGFDYIIQDNDRVSVYPVFESFDISEVTHLRVKPLRNNRFICDVHLGRLARYMRMLGFDVIYSNDFSKDDITGISLQQRRTILTRDRNLLKRNEIAHGYWIRDEDPLKQIQEVIERFQLHTQVKQFTRCMECNTLLNAINKNEIIDQLPPKIQQIQDHFFICRTCGKIYWPGTHFEKMQKLISTILTENPH